MDFINFFTYLPKPIKNFSITFGRLTLYGADLFENHKHTHTHKIDLVERVELQDTNYVTLKMICTERIYNYNLY